MGSSKSLSSLFSFAPLVAPFLGPLAAPLLLANVVGKAAQGDFIGAGVGLIPGGGAAKEGLFKIAGHAVTGSELLSVGFSAAAGLSTVAEGRAQSREFEAQARGSELQARTASLEGRRKGIQALEQANQLSASRFAVNAARGIESVGTPDVSAALDRERMRSNISLIRLGGAASSLGFQTQADAQRQRARSSRTQGTIGGLAQFGKGIVSAIER